MATQDGQENEKTWGEKHNKEDEVKKEWKKSQKYVSAQLEIRRGKENKREK